MNRRVLVMGPLNTGALAESYARAFERLGMNVVRFDSERAMRGASRFSDNRVLRRAMRSRLWNAANHEAVKIAQSAKPALIFAVKCAFFHPETVREIRSITGAPFVNHYPDNPYIGIPLDPRKPSVQRPDLIEVFRQYSMVWMWERSLLQRLQSDGVEARYLPFAVDPELFQAQPVAESLHCERCGGAHQVVFVGTKTDSRQAEIEKIRRHAVAIWGDSWPSSWRRPDARHRVHPPIYGPPLCRLYAQAPIALNVLNKENLGGPNMRTFEIPGSGGVMLARYSPAQNEIFPDGEAAAYYRSADEIDDKIDGLLADADLRTRLRRNAIRLATGQTYDLRAATVLRECGLALPHPVAR